MIYFASYFALFFAVGAFLGFWVGYLYRGRPAARAEAPSSGPDIDVAVAPSVDDDVLSLPDMTPAMASALSAAGITSLADLANLDGSALADTAAALKMEDFALRRFVGLAGMQGLDGVDVNLAQALVRIGVRSRTELAAENPDRVQNKLVALNDAEGLLAAVPDRAAVEALISAAK